MTIRRPRYARPVEKLIRNCRASFRSHLAEIAASPGRSIPLVVLRWLVQQGGVVALSRTTNPDRVAENLAIFDFELGEDEMAAIQTLAGPDGRIVNPPGLAPVWDR